MAFGAPDSIFSRADLSQQWMGSEGSSSRIEGVDKGEGSVEEMYRMVEV